MARLLAEGPPRSLEAAAYEIDQRLPADLGTTLAECSAAATGAGVRTSFQSYAQDYVQAAVAVLDRGLFDTTDPAGDSC